MKICCRCENCYELSHKSKRHGIELLSVPEDDDLEQGTLCLQASNGSDRTTEDVVV